MLKRLVLNNLPFIGLFGLAAIAVWAVGQLPQTAHAQSNLSRTCRAAIIIDRSGSVGGNMPTLKEQVRRLFQPTGLYDDKIQVAFWSFSHAIAIFGPIGNYNAPFYGYVTTRGETSGFMSALSNVQPGGNTNYQQGFGYNGTTRNPELNDIIEATDIVVFMTDGQPNSPNLATAAQDGRNAAQNHINAGRSVIGGSIGANSTQVRVINYVVSNDYDNYNNTFTVSTNYNDLAIKLKERIETKCNQLFPPEPCPYDNRYTKDDPLCVPPPATPPYNLKPVVNADNTVISSDESAGFDFSVNNTSENTADAVSGWSIKQVVIEKDQRADPVLTYGTDANPYMDEYSCARLIDLLNDKATCQDVASGTKQFLPNGVTRFTDAEVGGASRLVIDDRWPIGTKVCYVLHIAKPTEKAAPTNRFSRAACVVIGKRPAMQAYGGDLSVGGLVPGDTEPLNPVASKIHVGLTIKKNEADATGKVFGSWVEYGGFAPGAIVGLGTASGLQGGYPSTTGELQGLWSKLTFANENDEYGNFADSRTMPDTIAALLAHQARTLLATDDPVAFNGPGVTSGVYEKQDGDIRLQASVLGKGKSVIVYAPNGTVTIEGNLSYTDEPLTALNDIPRLVIIAKRIDIRSNVTNVDAWLLARNSLNGTGGGVINTCSDGPAALSINDCNQQLRINGPVMARHLLLRRTAGAGTGAASDQPAEIINLRADVYLSALARRTDVTVPMTTYSVELPPRF